MTVVTVALGFPPPLANCFLILVRYPATRPAPQRPLITLAHSLLYIHIKCFGHFFNYFLAPCAREAGFTCGYLLNVPTFPKMHCNYTLSRNATFVLTVVVRQKGIHH